MNASALAALISANPAADAPALLAIAQADPRMVHAIAASDLNPWLGNNGITPRLNRTAKYIAGLDVPTARALLQIASEMPDANVPVIAQLTADQITSFTTYAASGLPFAADTLEVAGKAVKLLALCIGLNGANPTLGVSQAEGSTLVSLGGGYRVFDATLDDATAAVSAFQFHQNRTSPLDALEQSNRDRYNAAAGRLFELRTSTDPVPATLADVDALGNE